MKRFGTAKSFKEFVGENLEREYNMSKISEEDLLEIFPKGRDVREYWIAIGSPSGIGQCKKICMEGIKAQPVVEGTKGAPGPASKRKAVLLLLVYFAMVATRNKVRTFERKTDTGGMPALIEKYQKEANQMGVLCGFKAI
jgi:hypothetical protein